MGKSQVPLGLAMHKMLWRKKLDKKYWLVLLYISSNIFILYIFISLFFFLLFGGHAFNILTAFGKQVLQIMIITMSFVVFLVGSELIIR